MVILDIFNFNLFAIEKNNIRNLNTSISEKGISNVNQKFFDEQFIKTINFNRFNDAIKTDFEKLINKLSTLISENNNSQKIEDKTFMEVIADKQFDENGIFNAEGNVIVILKNGELKTDKLIYDSQNKIIRAEGNVIFSKGKQFFEANYLEYNVLLEKGYIDDIYGVIDFEMLKQDLNLDLILSKDEICNEGNFDLLNLPSEVRLLNSSNIRFKSKFGLDALKLNFSEIKRWRFKSKRIYISSNKWNSDFVSFTNDPFNEPQLYVNSKNFSGEIINGRTVLKSRSTFINLDNKISIPVGGRTISDNVSKASWGIGYESNEKDGLYISRSYRPIVKSENLIFKLQPYFLLQRAILGESNAFRAKGSSVLSDNKKTDIDSLDFLALKGTIETNIFNSNTSLETNLKTLNPERLYDGFKLKFNSLKNIYKATSRKDQKSKSNCDYSADEKYFFSEYKTDLGIYGSLEESNIYSSYGTKIINQYKSKKDFLTKNYSLIFDVGNFQDNSLENSNKLEWLDRYSINSSFTHTYKIYTPTYLPIIFGNEYNFTPNIIDQGISLKGNLSAAVNEYSNNKSQSIIQASLGPIFTFGYLKDKFLDYTSLSIIPEYSYKKGKSPFYFDDFNEDSRLRINLRQQLYGPILVGFATNLNLNNSSEKYGTLESKEYSLGISRRAYAINLNYDDEAKSVLLNFNIFNFGYKDFSPSF